MEWRASGAPQSFVSVTQPCPLLPPLAALERAASAVFFTENRIECNAPTSTTGKQGPGWADVWPRGPTGLVQRICGSCYESRDRIYLARGSPVCPYKLFRPVGRYANVGEAA